MRGRHHIFAPLAALQLFPILTENKTECIESITCYTPRIDNRNFMWRW